MNATLFIGLAIVVSCTTVQCALIALLRRCVVYWRGLRDTQHSFFEETLFLSVIVAALFLGMCVQVGIWAVVFMIGGEFTDWSSAIYFSMTSFTTLGYGDVVLTGDNRILGPMEASNGILMLGLATGFLFSTLESRLQDHDDPNPRAAAPGE